MKKVLFIQLLTILAANVVAINKVISLPLLNNLGGNPTVGLEIHCNYLAKNYEASKANKINQYISSGSINLNAIDLNNLKYDDVFTSCTRGGVSASLYGVSYYNKNSKADFTERLYIEDRYKNIEDYIKANPKIAEAKAKQIINRYIVLNTLDASKEDWMFQTIERNGKKISLSKIWTASPEDNISRQFNLSLDQGKAVIRLLTLQMTLNSKKSGVLSSLFSSNYAIKKAEIKDIKVNYKINIKDNMLSLTAVGEASIPNLIYQNDVVDFDKATINNTSINYTLPLETLVNRGAEKEFIKVVLPINMFSSIKVSTKIPKKVLSILKQTWMTTTQPLLFKEKNSISEKLFTASVQQVAKLRNSMYETLLQDKVNKKKIDGSLVDAIISKDLQSTEKLSWKKMMSPTNSTYRIPDKIFILKCYPEIADVEEYQKIINGYYSNLDNLNLGEPIYRNALDYFILTDKSHSAPLWVELLCKKLGLNSSEIIFKNSHFYIKGKSEKFIPNDGNCAFHAIQYLISQKPDFIFEFKRS